jgi:hypothetical protein
MFAKLPGARMSLIEWRLGDPRCTRRKYYDGLLLLKDFVPTSIDDVKLKQNDYLELLFVRD